MKVNVLMTDDGMLCILHTGLYTVPVVHSFPGACSLFCAVP